MPYYIFLLPFGGALTARFLFRRWLAWLAWASAGGAAIILAWLVGFTAIQAIRFAVLASIVGFVSPELWEAIQQFLRRPRTITWIVGGLAGIYVLTHPCLLQQLMALGIVCLGIWIILRPILRR